MDQKLCGPGPLAGREGLKDFFTTMGRRVQLLEGWEAAADFGSVQSSPCEKGLQKLQMLHFLDQSKVLQV